MRIAFTISLIIFSSLRLLATAQTPEILILEGKKENLFAEPLEVYFGNGHPRPPLFDEPLSSGLWRGYIGTWVIKDNELYLRSLVRPTYKSVNGESIVENTDFLTNVFPEAKGPVQAKWFSGVISVPRGEMLRYVHMGFGSVFSKVLYLTVKDGKVTARREIDNKEFGATRSDADMQWVAMGDSAIQDTGDWIDARTILKHPPNGPFRTRGIYFSNPSDQWAHLWIPDTPTTEAVEIRIDHSSVSGSLAEGSHVEIQGIIEKDKDGAFIKMDSIRELKPGESMHHKTFRKKSK